MEKAETFEKIIWPHLASAYNLARWLTRRESDAEEVVQQAMLRAFKFFDTYHGGEPRAWLLAIVRNTGYSWLRQNRSRELASDVETDFEQMRDSAPGPDRLAIQNANRRLLHQALDALPLEFREVLVLRELEGLSYKEICEVADLPMGTVMSRLARARDRLQRAVLRLNPEEIRGDL